MGEIKVYCRLDIQKCCSDFGAEIPIAFYLRGTQATGTKAIPFISKSDTTTIGKLKIDGVSIQGNVNVTTGDLPYQFNSTLTLNDSNTSQFVASGVIRPPYCDSNGQLDPSVASVEFIVTFELTFNADNDDSTNDFSEIYEQLLDAETEYEDNPTVAQFYCHARVS